MRLELGNMSFIEAVFEYQFLQKALLTSVVVGLICGIIGCFIILRGLALMGDAISHAVLPGVALSYMLKINYFFGAVITGIITAIAIAVIIPVMTADRKSTRLNSSHVAISYAVFCLKKKKK